MSSEACVILATGVRVYGVTSCLAIWSHVLSKGSLHLWGLHPGRLHPEGLLPEGRSAIPPVMTSSGTKVGGTHPVGTHSYLGSVFGYTSIFLYLGRPIWLKS